jgi:hypothetical protein
MARSTGEPHEGQNFAPGGNVAPHREHREPSDAPHPMQKRAPSGFSTPHEGQAITGRV